MLAITRDPPPLARAFREELGLPFPLVCDLRGVAFRAYGLARSPSVLLSALHPRLWPRYLRAVRRAGLHRPGQDVLQLGGTFVLDREGVVVLAHPQHHPDDHPLLDRVAAAVAQHHAAVVYGHRVRLRPPQPGEDLPEASGCMVWVVEGPAGPGAVLALEWPRGGVGVLWRNPERWNAQLEEDARSALQAYARGELGLKLPHQSGFN